MASFIPHRGLIDGNKQQLCRYNCVFFTHFVPLTKYALSLQSFHLTFSFVLFIYSNEAKSAFLWRFSTVFPNLASLRETPMFFFEFLRIVISLQQYSFPSIISFDCNVYFYVYEQKDATTHSQRDRSFNKHIPYQKYAFMYFSICILPFHE